MSAHDETWRVGRKVGRTLYTDDGTGDGALIGVLDTREQAHLAAAAPDLYRALDRVEWIGGSCPVCLSLASSGYHHANCVIDAALRKARGVP